MLACRISENRLNRYPVRAQLITVNNCFFISYFTSREITYVLRKMCSEFLSFTRDPASSRYRISLKVSCLPVLIHECIRVFSEYWRIQSSARQGFSSTRHTESSIYFSHIRHCEGCSCAVPRCGDSIRTFLHCRGMLANATIYIHASSSSSRGTPPGPQSVCAHIVYEIELLIDVCIRAARKLAAFTALL